MKKTQIIRPVMVAAAFCLPVAVRGQQDFTNRFTASARLGFNIKAKFGPRLTPDGLAYDHFDGYALTDTGGSASAYTWNWGYDNSAHQISGNNILMSRQPSGGPSLGSYDSDPDYGFEIGYSRPLIVKGKLRFGVEAAGNYMKLDLRDDSGFSGTGTVDSYSFTPGTMPPQSPDPASGQPYQGTVKGPGFLINVPPVSAPAPIAFADHRKFDADVWGFRLGPYLEYPIGEHFGLWLSGGLAAAFLDGEASWTQTVSVGGAPGSSASGAGKGHDALWGGYVAANVSWQFSEHWSALAGAQWQDVGTYQRVLGGRQVELDLSNSIFVTFGVGYSF